MSQNWFFHASIENVALIADIPNFFKHWKMLPMFRWFVCSMFLNWWRWTHVLVSEEFSSLFIWVWSFCTRFLVAWRTFSSRLTWEFSTRFWVAGYPVWCLSDSFSFIAILRLDQGSQTWWEKNLLLALSAHHQINSSCFCHRWAIVRSRVLSSLRHGTNRKALLWPEREKALEMATRTHGETHYIEHTQWVLPLISRETSFGQNVSKLFIGVNLFGLDLGFQVDSVQQPINSNSVGVWTHVSSSDFVP